MSLARQFASVGGATLASRLLGFVRETLVAAALGTGPVADAFYTAFRFPNLFRRLLAEGAFNAAFIPLFSRTLQGEGEEAARRFAEDVLAALLVVLVVLTVAVEIFAPQVVALIAPGFTDDPEKFRLTVALFRIMFPYLAAMSLTAMVSGILNAYRRFFVAALAPTLLNIFSILALGLGLASDMSQEEVGRVQSFAVLAAGIGQVLMVVVAARVIGVRLRFRWPRMTANVKRLLILAGPAAVAGGITQINLFVNQIIASGKDGAIAVLQYADRLYQLPLGVVGIAVGVVLLPELSRVLKDKRFAEARETQNRSLEFALFLTLPCAAALAILPREIVAVLYERGAFGSDAAAITAGVIRVFALGLPAFVMIKVFMPGFFAREDTRTPMVVSVLSVAINVVLALLLFPRLAEAGIAAAETASGWSSVLMLAGVLVWRGHFAFDAAFVRRLPGFAAATAALGLVLWFGARPLAPYLAAGASFPVQAIALLALCGAGGLAYLAVAQATGAVDLRTLAGSLRRRRPDPSHTADPGA